MAGVPGDVLIIGAGIGGLTLALQLHRAGIPCRIYEAAPEIAPAGVGINVLPHASAILAGLGLEEALTEVAVTTRERAARDHGKIQAGIHGEGAA